MRGRKPKPVETRQRRNKPPEVPVGGAGPEFAVGECPPWFGTEAKAEWDRLVPPLAELDGAMGLDRGALISYCTAYGRLMDVERQLAGMSAIVNRGTKEEPNPVINPLIAVANATHDRMLRLCAELRLTPVSRTRSPLPRRAVAAAKITAAVEPVDPRLRLVK